MTHSRLIALLGAVIAGPALAAEPRINTPYGQVRTAVEQMEDTIADLDQQIDRRRARSRDKAVECLREHRAAITSLHDLARSERARLVEAMADDEPHIVEAAHRNVMLWQIKARVHVDAIGACPSQQEYDFAKDLAEIEAAAPM